MTVKENTFFVQGKLLEVLDGDTVNMKINYGFGLFQNVSIRLDKIDAPEIFGVKKNSAEYLHGQIVKAEVCKWFEGEPEIYILKFFGRECHGRMLGEIWKDFETESLNEYLISKFYKSSYVRMVRYEKLNEKW